MHGGLAIGRQPVARARAGAGRGAVCRVSAATARTCGARCWSPSPLLLAFNLFRAARRRRGSPSPARRMGPARMSPRGRPVTHRGRRARKAASRTSCGRCKGLGALSLAARIRSSCGCGSCWRSSFWSPASSSTSTCRSSTSTRSMRCRRQADTGGVVAVPVALIVAYGARAGAVAGLQRAAQRGLRQGRPARGAAQLALAAFRHLHALSLRFHLERRTGGLSRAIERGTAGIDFLLSFMLFNVVPTMFEILLVCGILWRLFDWTFRRGHLGDDRRSISSSPSRSPIGGCASAAR